MLVVWPWAPQPFSTPKWAVAGLAAAASLVLLQRMARRPGRVALAAVATLSAAVLSTLLAPGATQWWVLAGPLLIAVMALVAPPLPWRALAWAGGLASAVVLLQVLGLDPFAPLAPEAEGSRLRLYGTLGNPDFVASVVGVTGPVTVLAVARGGRRWAVLAAGLALLQLLALVLLRSFATTLALAAATAVVVLAAPQGRSRRSLALALGAGLLATAIPLAGRPTAPVLQGRWYLWTTAAPHVLDAPWTGQGPGTVVLHWPAWELERWRARCGTDPTCVAAHPQSRFAGLQDHLHSDWLEQLLDAGVPGLLALLALFATALVAAVRSATREGLAVAAGLASLAARATVDFPLARPADLVLLGVLCGTASRLEGSESVDAAGGSPPDSAPQGGEP